MNFTADKFNTVSKFDMNLRVCDKKIGIFT